MAGTVDGARTARSLAPLSCDPSRLSAAARAAPRLASALFNASLTGLTTTAAVEEGYEIS